jgi:hypothetical protein
LIGILQVPLWTLKPTT